MEPNIAIIYLCYGNLRHLPEVVASWEKLIYPKERVTIIILPAHSPDGIADVIARDVVPRSGKDLPRIVVIDEENRGFTVNNNVGLRYALAHGYDYVFLENGDLRLAPDALTEAVHIAETNAQIGAVQSLVCYWHNEAMVNVSGGMVHVAGYGYARDNGKMRRAVTVRDAEEIAYASGAAVLYRASALRRVGLFEEGFFMYHDDLELGLRLMLAGYTNVLAPRSLAYHDYQFGRNEKMFFWIEMNRWIVLLAYLRVRTILLLVPLWCMIEFGSWCMMVLCGSGKVKLRAYRAWLNAKPWKLLWGIRRRVQPLRVITDRTLVHLWTGRIEAQATASPFMDHVVNPVVDALWRMVRCLIVW